MNTENTLLPSGLGRLHLGRIQQFLTSHNANPINQLPNWLKQYFTNNQLVHRRKRADKGHVYLIGAGPGDAELLTLKAHRLIQQADVVMFDWLVNPDIIKMNPSHVERVFVGKKCGRHSMQQADICQLMVEVALTGKNIVRLKGGDPAIFARAAEECDILAKHNIDFAIVPGITAASGASAYAGIPLTHRECAQSVRFITAHLKSIKSIKSASGELKSATDEPNWQALVAGAGASHSATHGETLVFYMGLKRIETIMQRLETHGLAANTPVAVIDQASTAQQQVCIGTLENIAKRVTEQNFQGPAVTIVGEVVNKRHKVNLSLLSESANELAATA
ncbi:uroporphyrinogen-III C-methyltransferase [Paraglaciecola sp. MB-3u-78]|uniref:uroporphyrinogen-III C-methyltransferase n=1 Tax=Paraglaciecola sp. MB-3u-78 TaxID=2058332 RepID=UPI000C341DB5|nr:uroporphyrinogen-III C-methyltransferase [Paraglaciecola sp. MB-3u-78]PKG96740.1 uroporphyrinogen-III C-methyltransferase [Paraglaciecola sp. MB-3u-78]